MPPPFYCDFSFLYHMPGLLEMARETGIFTVQQTILAVFCVEIFSKWTFFLESLNLRENQITPKSIHSISYFTLLIIILSFRFVFEKRYATLIMYVYILLDISKLSSLENLDLGYNNLNGV